MSEQDGGKEQPESELPPGATAVRSSLPGSVWKVNVQDGQAVSEGDVIVIVESMKMEFAMQAPRSGRIVSVRAKPGESVQAGQLLMGIEAAGSTEAASA
ncbi:MAG TPA: acetyl-CoA carboxylase biotin carboxyl carrier protein subunit [Paenibacillus sp.]|nr:acetyl-CoA carboxylase biotin carboxyl carrier protein subunit [Paenibacillus sp.]